MVGAQGMLLFTHSDVEEVRVFRCKLSGYPVLVEIEVLRSLLKPRASICLKREEELYSGQLDLGIFFEVLGNGWDQLSCWDVLDRHKSFFVSANHSQFNGSLDKD